jgi:predicted flap endonuclease-1-like 5' DNA nuclease
MSVDLGPPQISPDGKWIWDGQKWLPIPPAEPAEPAASIPYPAPEPEPVAYVYSPAEANPPAWQQPAAPTRLSPYRIGAAGAVVLLVIVVVLNATNIISIPWPWIAAEPTVTMIHGSPPPIVSDYVLADRFLNLELGPAIVSLGNTLPPVKASCAPATNLSSACHTAINATNTQMLNVLSVIKHASIPDCIAIGTKALQNDLQDMSGGIGVALHGFLDSSSDEVSTGITHFAIVAQSLQTDANAINAELPTCSRVFPS